MNAAYNDIQPWHFKDLVRVFGAKEGQYKTFQIKSKAQVNDLFEDTGFNAAEFLQFVELYIPREDAPRALKVAGRCEC